MDSPPRSPGRPPVDANDPGTVTTAVRLPSVLRARLGALARVRRIPLSTLVRTALTEYLERETGK